MLDSSRLLSTPTVCFPAKTSKTGTETSGLVDLALACGFHAPVKIGAKSHTAALVIPCSYIVATMYHNDLDHHRLRLCSVL